VTAEAAATQDLAPGHPLTFSGNLKYLEIMKPRRKELVVSKNRMLTIYPTLHETTEKGMLRRIIKKLIHIRKGH
jgi:hypothetical protein